MRRDPIHRLFYAIYPPKPEQNRLFNLATEFEGAQQADRLHATLAITNDFLERPEFLVRAMRNAGDSIAAAPFSFTLDRLAASKTSVAARPAPRQASIVDFQRSVVAAMNKLGGDLRDDWSFNPHITLAYRAGVPFNRPTTPISWVVREFVLIHSVVGRTQHNLLGRWSLNGLPESDLFGQRPVDRPPPMLSQEGVRP